MILQALTEYYGQLAKKGSVPKYGWAESKISYAIELDQTGTFIRLQSLMQEVPQRKKNIVVPRNMVLPAPVRKASGIRADFLFGNCMYIFGLDTKGKPERARQAFEACKDLHQQLLKNLSCVEARAVIAFFAEWDPSTSATDPRLQPFIDDLQKGALLVFQINDHFAEQAEEIEEAWDRHYQTEDETEDSEKMIDLVTGEIVVPQPTHPLIKGFAGSTTGNSLISFNAPADCSYDKEQNLNAPVGKYASFAYTSALNYLLSKRDGQGYLRFAKAVGDTTLVFWAEDADEKYQDALSELLDGDTTRITNRELQSVVTSVCKGEPVDWHEAGIKPDNKFYLLGLSPNSARLCVRFFYSNSFGNIVNNIEAHYSRMQLIKPSFETSNVIPLWMMLQAIGDQKASNKNPSPQLSGDILKAIITGHQYPTTMFQQLQLRIRGDRDINWKRASIIKAYLLRNTDKEINKEVLTVQLNEETTYQPYVLGRLFSVLEEIQSEANPTINTTIKDKYFSSACSTPAVIFPILLSLTEKHLRKFDTGKKIYYSKKLQGITSMITETYPAHLTLTEQGVFQLGYYHQTQKRFTKKTEEN